jgi:hypothetical protein
MNRRAALAGVIVATIYTAVVVATVAARAGHVRPLYDGFVPPAPYQWIDPPDFFAAGNTKPRGGSTTIALGPAGSAETGFGSPDGQFVVDLPRGAVAPHSGEHALELSITPLAASKFRPLPNGLRANGNVYRVELHYARSGAPVTALARPGTLLVETPEVGSGLFRARDERPWAPVRSTVLGGRQLSSSAAFTRPGNYVSGTSLPVLVAGPRSSRNWWLLGGATALVFVLLFAGAAFFARRRASSVIAR